MSRFATLLAVSCLLLTAAAEATPPPEFQLVESTPVETQLDLPDIPQAPDVWLEMIRGAEREICIASFYMSDDPGDDDDPLDRVLVELAAAGARGVAVRVLTDKGFHKTYPQIPDRLNGLPGCESRLLDARARWGGILHAKYMIIDGRECYVGSQNWDWRSLMHIRELGARIRKPELAQALHAVFAIDWAIAGGEQPPTQTVAAGPFELTTTEGPAGVTMAASPAVDLPTGMGHDLEPLTAMIDGARHELSLQVLSYHVTSRDGSQYLELDTALRRAAGRGVKVRVIVSNWAKSRSQAVWLQSLACLPNIEVRFTNIPAWSGGFVPFGRVEHAKYLVVDGRSSWLSTSNWAPGYFSDSRNISLFIQGEGIAAQLTRFFESSWSSPYAETVVPGRTYQPPRRKE